MRLFGLLLSFLLATSFASAQLLPLSGDIVTSPENPKPNERVTVSLQGYNFDPSTLAIEWYVDGVLFQKGPGLKSVTLTTKRANEDILIGIYGKASDGREFRSALRLNPQATLLLYEAIDSYVPLFYEGRAVPGEGASVKIVAYPTFSASGKTLSPSTLVYSWSVNDVSFTSLSGYGKRSFEYRQDDLNENNTVTVVVKNQEETAATRADIVVQPYPITPFLYIVDDVLGTFLSRVFTERATIAGKTRLAVVPYGFSYQEGRGTFSWSLGGAPATAESDLSISLYPEEDSTGSALLRVQGSHSSKQLQTFTKEVGVSFDTRR